ncbi:MAG: SDR family oxidoreductase [Cyanobacteria bacterium P01_H01_bin.15]
MDLNGKRVIITGGSSGIGKALALQLAKRNCAIALVARNAEKLQQTRTEILQAFPGTTLISCPADVAQRIEITETITSVIAKLGGVDILVAGAGIAQPGYFEALELDTFEKLMSVNYFGAVYCVKAVLETMKNQQSGHIALISSGAGLIGVYGYSAYGPTKFALRGLGESLRCELKPGGIGVSVVYPPDTDTPQLAYENKTKPPETAAIAGSAGVLSAEVVAQAILKGIERNQFAVTPGFEMSLLNRVHSLIAPAFFGFCDRIVAKHQNEKKKKQ